MSVHQLVVVLLSLVLVEIYRIREIDCSFINLDLSPNFQWPGRLARTLNDKVDKGPRRKAIVEIIEDPGVCPRRANAVD